MYIVMSTWPNHSPSFLSSFIPIISGGRYNLWIYTLCSFLHFLLLSAIRSTDWQALFPNPVYSLPSMSQNKCLTHTAVKILHEHTHVYTAIVSFLKAGRRAKQYEVAVCISITSFPLICFILKSLLLNATP